MGESPLTDEDYARCIRMATSSMVPVHGNDYEDALQEATIGVWKARQRTPDMSWSLVWTVARRKVATFLAGGITGRPLAQSRLYESGRLSYTDLYALDEGAAHPLEAPGPDTWVPLETAVREALGQVSDGARSYVVSRFYEDRPWDEWGAYLGLAGDTARVYWRKTWRAEVQSALQEVANAVYA